ncbi:MAG: hypothetical protein WCM76_06780 [Bacteroidota bacterium]
MKKLFFLVAVSVLLISCNKNIFKFAPNDKRIFDQCKLDLKNLQLFSPQYKCFLIGGTYNVAESVNPLNCRIEALGKIKTDILYLRPYTKLTCVKEENGELYISIDESFPLLVFHEGLDGYYLKTDNSGFITIDGKDYYCPQAFYLMVKGKYMDKSKSSIRRIKGNKPKCQ